MAINLNAKELLKHKLGANSIPEFSCSMSHDYAQLAKRIAPVVVPLPTTYRGESGFLILVAKIRKRNKFNDAHGMYNAILKIIVLCG